MRITSVGTSLSRSVRVRLQSLVHLAPACHGPRSPRADGRDERGAVGEPVESVEGGQGVGRDDLRRCPQPGQAEDQE